jgi:hypothetical protein
MNSNYMESIEPYDYSQLRPFGTEYLSGYMADKYDINADDCRTRAEQRIKASTESIFAGTASGYSSCVPVSSDVRFKHANRYYSLMPVWMLNTKYNDKAYMFAMNGQTGKLVGELPISWGKFWAWFLGLGAGISVLVTVLMMFFR